MRDNFSKTIFLLTLLSFLTLPFYTQICKAEGVKAAAHSCCEDQKDQTNTSSPTSVCSYLCNSAKTVSSSSFSLEEMDSIAFNTPARFFISSFEGKPGNDLGQTFHSPPLYLSLKTFLS